MNARLWIVIHLVCVLPSSAQTPAPESRPLRPAQSSADMIEDRITRLEKAAKRYLDLANASTDAKETADFLRLYEEKERALAEIYKEGEAERKCKDAMEAIRGWNQVALNAHGRAFSALLGAEKASEDGDLKIIDAQLKVVEQEGTNVASAEEEVLKLVGTDSRLCIAHRAHAVIQLHYIQDESRKIHAFLEKVRDLRTAAASRPK